MESDANNVVIIDPQITKKRDVNPFYTILLFLLSVGCLVMAFLYRSKVYSIIVVDKIESDDIQSENFRNFGKSTINSLDSEFLNINQLNIDNFYNNSNSVQFLKSKSNDISNLFINENNIEQLINPVLKIENNFTNYPNSFGFISFRYSCEPYVNGNWPCQSQNYTVDANNNQIIYLNGQSQYYHFRNKYPPCPLFDSISDQIVNPNCTSKCNLNCPLMVETSNAYADYNTLKDLPNKVSINVKNSLNLDSEIQFKNFNSQNCFVFGNQVSSSDIKSDDYCEIEHTVYFTTSFNNIPFVDVSISTASGISNIKDKITSNEWRSKYQSTIETNNFLFCFYNNLPSILYPDDVISGTTRMNVAVGVTEVTNTYFKFIVSTNYGYKLSNGYTVNYYVFTK